MGITIILWGRSNLLICYEACLVLVNSSVQFKGLSERVYSQTCHEDKHLNSDYLTTCGYCLIIYVWLPHNMWLLFDHICLITSQHVAIVWSYLSDYLTTCGYCLIIFVKVILYDIVLGHPGNEWKAVICFFKLNHWRSFITRMSIVLLGFRWCYWDVDGVTGMSIVLPGCRLCICRSVSHYCIVFNEAWQYTMIIHNNKLIINYLLEVITHN